MNDSLNELVLKKNVIQQNKYITNLIISALELAIQRIEYFEERTQEEKAKAEIINIDELNGPLTLDQFVYMPNLKPDFNNKPELIDIINFISPRVKWKIEDAKSIQNFITDSIWSLKKWDEVKNWCKNQHKFYTELNDKHQSHLMEIELEIIQFPYSKNSDDFNESNSINPRTNNDLKSFASPDDKNLSEQKLNLSSDSFISVVSRDSSSNRQVEDLKIFNVSLPDDIAKINADIHKLNTPGKRNIKKIIVSLVLDLYETKYKGINSISSKSDFITIVFPFIDLDGIKWDLSKFLKYAQNR